MLMLENNSQLLDYFSDYNDITTLDGKTYLVSSLIEESKNLPIFNMPVAGANISYLPWNISNIREFTEHLLGVIESDITHPIIFTPDGLLADGHHRLVRAIVEGVETIPAVRLKEMPKLYKLDE